MTKNVLTQGNDVERELMSQINEEANGLSSKEKKEIMDNIRKNMNFYLQKLENNLDKFPTSWGENEAYALFGNTIRSIMETGVLKKALKDMKKNNKWYSLSI
jgi:hypothetical protein